MTIATEQIADSFAESLHGVDVSTDGVFKNLKICGPKSKNGRSYPESTRRTSAHLYEGAPVYINHTKGNENPAARSYENRFGVIINPRAEADGTYGDLKYNPKHAMAESVKWDIVNRTKGVGLSHVVQANAVRRNGEFVVESISSVISVDIVDAPATNNSFFEQSSGDSDVKFADITIEQIKKERPDLITALAKEQEGDANNQALQKKLDEATKELLALKRDTAIDLEIKEAGLTLEQISDVFRKQLVAIESADDRKALLKDRAELVKASGGESVTKEQGGKQLSNPSSKAPGGTTQESTKVGNSFTDRKKFLMEQNRRR